MKRLGRTAALVLGLNILMLRPAYPESIPLKLEGGTYVVPVLINAKITLNFTLDSGAAEVSIPADVFGTLLRAETISKADLLEPGEYALADGSTRREPRFRIRSLKVGDLELRDVVASVAPVQGNLLLGQSFLSRVRNWSVDNQRHVLVLNEDSAPAPKDSADASPYEAGHRSAAPQPAYRPPTNPWAGPYPREYYDCLRRFPAARTSDEAVAASVRCHNDPAAASATPAGEYYDCLRRFPAARTSDEAVAASARCHSNPSAAPP